MEEISDVGAPNHPWDPQPAQPVDAVEQVHTIRRTAAKQKASVLVRPKRSAGPILLNDDARPACDHWADEDRNRVGVCYLPIRRGFRPRPLAIASSLVP